MADETTERTCHCRPCPGRGNDGHGMQHCAECCFGTGVEAEPECPVRGRTEQEIEWIDERSYRLVDRIEPTEQAGREALLEVMHAAGYDGVGGLADVVIAAGWTGPETLRTVVHGVGVTEDLAFWRAPEEYAAVMADRDALKRRLDEAEAKVERVRQTAFDWISGTLEHATAHTFLEALDGDA